MVTATKKRPKTTETPKPAPVETPVDPAITADPEPVDASDGIVDNGPLVGGAEHDPERAKLTREAAELRAEIETLKLRLSKVDELDMAIIDAGIEVDRLERYIGDLDADRKEAKEDLKKAVATLRACVIRRKTGQKELFTPQDLAQTTAPVVAAVIDEGASADIRMLLGKEIKKIVGPEEFQAAKDRGEPIGMTEKQVEVLEAQGWTTIGQLEKALRENAWWHKELKGFGPDKIDRLTITLAAFRRAHPMPSETTVTVTVGDSSVTTTPEGLRDLAETVPTPDAGAEVTESIAVPEWQQAAERIRAMLESANALMNHGPGDCIEFMESVTTQASDMLAWITEHEHVTEEQSVAITNWAEGIAKWYPQN